MAVGNAVLHLGMAALNAYGAKSSLNLPPPPAAFATAAGNLGVQMLWLNPQFVNWTFELLWPVVIGAGGMYLAKATPAHTADYGLRDSNGRIITRGEVDSSTGMSDPSWEDQNANHWEQKIYRTLKPKSKPGDIVTISGTEPPCQRCNALLRRWASQCGIKILYSNEGDVTIYGPDGSVQPPLGLR